MPYVEPLNYPQEALEDFGTQHKMLKFLFGCCQCPGELELWESLPVSLMGVVQHLGYPGLCPMCCCVWMKTDFLGKMSCSSFQHICDLM